MFEIDPLFEASCIIVNSLYGKGICFWANFLSTRANEETSEHGNEEYIEQYTQGQKKNMDYFQAKGISANSWLNNEVVVA